MIQNIIVVIILLSVLAYVTFTMYRRLRSKKSDECNCGCGSKKVFAKKNVPTFINPKDISLAE